jgi:hypothetical protein
MRSSTRSSTCSSTCATVYNKTSAAYAAPHLEGISTTTLTGHQPACRWKVPVRDGRCGAILCLTQRGVHGVNDGVVMRQRVKLIVEHRLRHQAVRSMRYEALASLMASMKCNTRHTQYTQAVIST